MPRVRSVPRSPRSLVGAWAGDPPLLLRSAHDVPRGSLRKAGTGLCATVERQAPPTHKIKGQRNAVVKRVFKKNLV